MENCWLLLHFLGHTPTISSPLQSTMSIPSPPGLCGNGASCLVIGIIVTIAVVVMLTMIVVSSLIAYFIFHKRKRSNLIMDSKVYLCVYFHLCMPSSLSACKFHFGWSLYWHVCLSCLSSCVCLCMCVCACTSALPGHLWWKLFPSEKLLPYIFKPVNVTNLDFSLQETVYPSDGPNSETESTEQRPLSSTNVQAYQCSSDATKEYNQQKHMASACVCLRTLYLLCAKFRLEYSMDCPV